MRERIAAALKDSMRAKDETRTATLRLILAALKDSEIAARVEEGETRDDTPTALAILSKMVRQREESVKTYEEAGRLELADRERAEVEVIREFLPRPMTEDEVSAAVDDAIEKTGAGSIKDLGKVMASLKAEHAGRMDFAAAGRKVKAALG